MFHSYYLQCVHTHQEEKRVSFQEIVHTHREKKHKTIGESHVKTFGDYNILSSVVGWVIFTLNVVILD